jgi:hypothetical protein
LRKASLDGIAGMTGFGVKGSALLATAWRDHRLSAHGFNMSHQGSTVVTLVGQHMGGLKTLQQSLGLCDVVGLTKCQD